MQITKQQAAGLISRNRGKFFTVTFTKRTTGETRVLNGRQGVTKHLKGGEAAYNFSEKRLLPVFDVVKGEYRSIPIEGITEVKILGRTFQVS
jgi:hypothetical protein